jgi:hypothetical protein
MLQVLVVLMLCYLYFGSPSFFIYIPLTFPLFSECTLLLYLKAFPEADLKITLAGHSGMEKENIRELVTATEKFKNL